MSRIESVSLRRFVVASLTCVCVLLVESIVDINETKRIDVINRKSFFVINVDVL